MVSLVQNVYIDSADKVLKKVRKCKTNSKVDKHKQWFTNKECLIKRKEQRLITKAVN